MDFRSYLALEVALTRRLVKTWQKLSQPVYAAIEDAIKKQDWHAALNQVHRLDLTEVGTQNQEYIQHMMLSCALLGSKIANKTGPQFVAAGAYKQTLSHVTGLILQYLEHRATAVVQARVLQLIAQAETAAKTALLSAHKLDIASSDLLAGGLLNPEQAEATPMQPLYVCRPLLNGDQLFDWAKASGFNSVIVPASMHVTIMYSKQPVDWSVLPPDTKRLVARGGTRRITLLGNAIVLTFDNEALTARWQALRDAGCSWDYDGYTAHISLTYNVTPDVDLATLEPYSGPLIFGGEVYEPIDTDKDFVEKADDSGRYVTPFVSFADPGEGLLQMTSSLNSNRMATWGFTAECDQIGVTQYQLSAVLDGRTSAFCQMIDGTVFEVQAAKDLVNAALSVQDPADLAQVQPWPNQSPDSISKYSDMSSADLTEAGLQIPPFHPSCRTMCVLLGTTTSGTTPINTGSIPSAGEPPPALAGNPNQGPLPSHAATLADFSALGVKVTAEQLAHWNDYIGLNPIHALAKMFGLGAEGAATDDLAADLSDQLDGATIKITPDGNIKFFADGELDADADPVPKATTPSGIKPTKYNMQTVFDPYSSTLYLSAADFSSADPSRVTTFLGKVFHGMVDTGLSMGASAITLDVGAAAYDYAKMGFLPKPVDWQSIRLDAMDALQNGGLSGVLAALDSDQQMVVLNLLSNPDEHALQALVDLPFDVDGVPIGQTILDNVGGQFSLDLTDPTQVARIQEYLK